MVASLYCAKEWLIDDVIISYADIIYKQSVLEQLLNSSSDIIVSADREFLRYWKLRLANPLDDVESFVVNDAVASLQLGRRLNH